LATDLTPVFCEQLAALNERPPVKQTTGRLYSIAVKLVAQLK